MGGDLKPLAGVIGVPVAPASPALRRIIASFERLSGPSLGSVISTQKYKTRNALP